MAYRLCGRDDLRPGQAGVFSVGSRTLAVARTVDGRFHALRNRCPHQGAPLGLGQLDGTCMPGSVGEYRSGRRGEILRCPWHRWEFDVLTGRSLHDPEGCRVARYDVYVDGEDVMIDLG